MKKIFLYLGLVSFVALSGCYPEGPQYVEDMDVVITNYTNTFNFGSPSTFHLPAKVLKVTGNPDASNPVYLSDALGQPILARIRQNMVARGYTEVATEPDLEIFPASLEVTITYYYDYWYDYWGYPGGGYGWYYPPYYSSYSYSIGTLLINMIDAKSSNPDNSRNMVWVGAVNGLTGASYVSTTVNRINTTIDRAFTQSPYLKKN